MILRVAPDAEPVAGDLKSGSIRRSGDHLQFWTHPRLLFSPFGTRFHLEVHRIGQEQLHKASRLHPIM
jgi:hypothetical protein